MKKVIIIIISVFIAFSPLVTLGNFSFADSGGGGASGTAWIAVNDKESLVAAFKAYCQSRNYRQSFDYGHGVDPITKGIVNFNYDMMEKACTIAGLDINTINAGLWYYIDQNDTLKFWLTGSATNYFNQLYSAVLTEHGIQENSTDNLLYSGEYFEDSDGNGAFVYYSNSVGTGFNFTKKGTPYKYVSSLVKNMVDSGTSSLLFNLNSNQSVNVNISKSIISNISYYTAGVTGAGGRDIYITGRDGTYERQTQYGGGFAIIRANNTLYLGTAINYYTHWFSDNEYSYKFLGGTLLQINNVVPKNVNITANQGAFNSQPENKSMQIDTNDNSITNYITNNNSSVTYNYYDDDTPPSTDPVYTNPFDNNPTGGTIGSDGKINFQMPDININWNLGLDVNNLPFPFSIPFDIIRFLTILDTEPEAPKYEIHTSILNNPVNLDIDLSVFDEGMAIIRNIILVGYVLFLIISTRALFHIY